MWVIANERASGALNGEVSQRVVIERRLEARAEHGHVKAQLPVARKMASLRSRRAARALRSRGLDLRCRFG